MQDKRMNMRITFRETEEPLEDATDGEKWETEETQRRIEQTHRQKSKIYGRAKNTTIRGRLKEKWNREKKERKSGSENLEKSKEIVENM